MPNEPSIPQPGLAVPSAAGWDPHADLQERLRAATLGEYDILAQLGVGGMASVYLAHDLALDRRVAIKVLSPSMAYGPGLVERFRQEARTAAALSHPNIIPVYAVRETAGLLYFVMKVIDGTSLDAVVSEASPLPIPMIEAILAQVGGALGYAHRNGVVHRDIKPANILLDAEGWVVVTDFGIAKVTETSGLTLTGTAVGTPTYMSPEQCAGDAVSGASDQYALGVVAYEMITGQPPFLGKSIPALMVGHTTMTPPPILEARPDCPAALAAAVHRMLAKDPAARFDSVDTAIKAAEARPLAPDDPTHVTMVSLARSGASRQLIAQVRTPRSPVPLIQQFDSNPAVAQASASRSGWLVTGGIVAGIALAALVAMALGRIRTGGEPTGPVGATPAVDSSTSARSDTNLAQKAGVSQVPASAPEISATVRQPSPLEPKPSVVRPPTGSVASQTPPPSVTPQVESTRATSRQGVVVAPPPAASPPAVMTPRPPPPVVAPDPKAAVEQVIRSYAAALESGQISKAVQIFPSMPSGQRGGLEAFYRDGGTMKTAWRITDIEISGKTATLVISGTTTVTSSHTESTVERVSLRARLEQGDSGWRLVAMSN